MILTALPVDTLSAAEWDAGRAVVTARGTAHYLAAERYLAAVCHDDATRMFAVLATVDDAYRALAIRQHPASQDPVHPTTGADDPPPHRGEAVECGTRNGPLPVRSDVRRWELWALGACIAPLMLLLARGGWG